MTAKDAESFRPDRPRAVATTPICPTTIRLRLRLVSMPVGGPLLRRNFPTKGLS